MFEHEVLIGDRKLNVKSLPVNIKLEISKFKIAKKKGSPEIELKSLSKNISGLIETFIADHEATERSMDERKRRARALSFKASINNH